MNKFFTMVGVALLLVSGMAQAADEKALSKRGQLVAKIFSEYDHNALDKIFNYRGLANRTSDTIADLGKQRKGFVKGVYEKSKTDFARRTMRSLRLVKASAKYIRNIDFDKQRLPLVRLNLGESGFNYLCIVLDKDNKVVDWYSLADGYYLSQTIGSYGRLMTQPSEDLIGKFLGKKSVNKQVLKDFRAVIQNMQARKFNDAYKKLYALPKEALRSKVIISLAIQIASSIDESLYRKELARMAKFHSKDPSVAFILLDHYYYTKDYDALIKSINGLEKKLGVDGLTLLLKANAMLSAAKNKKSIAYAEKAVSIEPDMEDPYWTLVTNYLKEEKYKKVVINLEKLRKRFGYRYSHAEFVKEKLYAGFVKSAEYKNWMETAKK